MLYIGRILLPETCRLVDLDLHTSPGLFGGFYSGVEFSHLPRNFSVLFNDNSSMIIAVRAPEESFASGHFPNNHLVSGSIIKPSREW